MRVAIIDLRPYLNQLEQRENRLSLKVTLEKFNLVDGEYSIGLYYVLNNIRKEILDISQIRVKPSPVKNTKVSPYLPQYRGYVELKDNIKIG